MPRKNQKAAPAVVTQDANAAALVGFDTHVVADAFRAMSDRKALIETTTGAMQDAAVTLVLHAANVAAATREAGAEVNIADLWSATLSGLYPMLAAEGSRFIKVTPANGDKPAKYQLTGYGMNVNSIARGFCQYGDIWPADAQDENGNLTYVALRALVEARRRDDESAEAKALREAREALDEALKGYRKAALDTGKAEDILEFARALTAALEPEAIEATEEAETVVPVAA